MAASADGRRSDHGEHDEDDLRERYQELLQEFRVVLPGVQVFFAFLLTAPFASEFAELDHLGRTGYAVAVTSAALAVVVLITPAAYHHLHERRARSERVRATIRLKLIGLGLTGIAASAGLFVVIRFVFGPVEGWIALGAAMAAWVGLWFALPARQGYEPLSSR